MSSDTKRPRLLILDDEPRVGQHIVLVARALGYEARSTVTADQFFAEYERWQPTHLAIDLVLPGIDGIEVIHRLAQCGCKVPLMIFSGVDSRILASAQLSANEHGLQIIGALQKPFLQGSLRNLLMHAGGNTIPHSVRTPKHADVTEQDLRLALRRGEFEVNYQPKVDCTIGTVSGFEALARWQHADAGVVMPDEFIALAERTGLIHELTVEILRQSFAWIARSHPDLDWNLAVNLSPHSLTNHRLADTLCDLCNDYDLDPGRVILEVTETGAMEKPTEALDLLTRLRMRGFQIAIDDFGRGYSSMVQLVRMPFSELKIDRAFSMSATQTPESRAVIKSAVELGHSLGLRVIAEGVDSLQTLEYLRSIGCDFAQGFLISEAMTADEVVPWMVRRRITSEYALHRSS